MLLSLSPWFSTCTRTLSAVEIARAFRCGFASRPPSWIIVQATALRRMSSMSQAQLQSKSKSLAPPDTGSGLCPQHASFPAKLGQWLCLVNDTVEQACQLRWLQSFEGAGMTGNVESGPVHPRFAVPKPQLASGTRPPTRVGVLWTTTVGSVATSSGQWPSYRTAGEWESLG